MENVSSTLIIDGVPKLIRGTEEVITVQILNIKHLERNIYRIVVSDGSNWVYGQLFGWRLIDLVRANRLRSLSTVHVKKYSVDFHQNIFCMRIQDADMYNSEDGRVIGNPVQYKPENHLV